VVDDAVPRNQREVQCHELDDGPQAHHRRANGQAHHTGLRDRRVYDPFRAVFLQEVFGDLERALILPDLFAQKKDFLVSVQLFLECQSNRIGVGHVFGRAGLLMTVNRRRDIGNIFVVAIVYLKLRSLAAVYHLTATAIRAAVRRGFAVCRRATAVCTISICAATDNVADDGDHFANGNHGSRLGLDVQDAVFLGLDFDIAFIRLDLPDNFAGLDRFAVLLQPLKQRSLFHRIAHLGHNHFCHCFLGIPLLIGVNVLGQFFEGTNRTGFGEASGRTGHVNGLLVHRLFLRIVQNMAIP
jgi:hypothetical protein